MGKTKRVCINDAFGAVPFAHGRCSRKVTYQYYFIFFSFKKKNLTEGCLVNSLVLVSAKHQQVLF